MLQIVQMNVELRADFSAWQVGGGGGHLALLRSNPSLRKRNTPNPVSGDATDPAQSE